MDSRSPLLFLTIIHPAIVSLRCFGLGGAFSFLLRSRQLCFWNFPFPRLYPLPSFSGLSTNLAVLIGLFSSVARSGTIPLCLQHSSRPRTRYFRPHSTRFLPFERDSHQAREATDRSSIPHLELHPTFLIEKCSRSALVPAIRDDSSDALILPPSSLKCKPPKL